MRRTSRRVSNLAMAISFSAGGLLSCTEQEPVEESTVVGAIGDCDTDWVCGSNSPEIDHYGFHELHLEGEKNLEKMEIVTAGGLAQIYKAGVGYTLKVIDSRMYGFDKNGWPALAGAQLVGAELRLLHDGAESYTIRIEAVRPIPYAVGSQEDGLDAYSLSWHDSSNPPDGKRLICEPPTLLKLRSVSRPPAGSDELLGMRPGETVVFEGDRIDARSKTMSELPNTTWFNFGCAGHTLAKLHLTRNTIASRSADYGITGKDRQATLKMMVGDYCGDGRAFTVAGEPLRWKGGLVNFYTFPSSLEARWTNEGATCLNEPRLRVTSSPLAVQLFGPDIDAAIADHCLQVSGRVIPACTDLNVNNFDGAARVSGNP